MAEIDEIIARAQAESEREKKMGWYVASFIVGKTILLLVLWALYMLFIQKHLAPGHDADSSDSNSTSTTIRI